MNISNLHQAIHKVEKYFKCSICERGFRQKYNLNRHQLFHSKEKSFKCGTCQKCFKRKDELNIHQESHNKHFKCDICQQQFSYKYTLKRHQQKYKKVNPYKCEKCQKVFCRYNKFINHLRIKLVGKDCSSANLEDLNKTSIALVQKCKNYSAKYLQNQRNSVYTSVLTSKSGNRAITIRHEEIGSYRNVIFGKQNYYITEQFSSDIFYKPQQRNEDQHCSKDSFISAKQISVSADKVGNRFTTELCNKSHSEIDKVMHIQINEIPTTGTKLDHCRDCPYNSHATTEVDLETTTVATTSTEGKSQNSEGHLGIVNEEVYVSEHKIISTKEFSNEVYVKNNNLTNFLTGENITSAKILDKCDLCSFSSYDSTEVDLHYMSHFDEDMYPSDQTNNA